MGLYLGGDEVSQKISTVTIGSTLPDQTDNAGKFLTTDGENVSWKEVENEIYWVDTEDENVYNKVTEAINSNKLVMLKYEGDVYCLQGQHNDGSQPYIFSSVMTGETLGINLYTDGYVNKYAQSTQDLLKSGENIKTINGESILGSGDLEIKSVGSGRNVGDIFYTTRTDSELNGAVECNGGTYNIEDFEGNQSVGVLLNSGSLPYVSLVEYTSIVATNGSVRCFGWDGGNDFRVPLLNDVYIESGNAESAGEFISESLPNITGYLGTVLKITSTTGGGVFAGSTDFAATSKAGTSSGIHQGTVSFDASGSNSSYKNNAKVKPDSVRYRAMIQLANGATDEAVITATSALQQIGNKAEIDLSNVSSVSSSFIKQCTSWGMPDYNAGVSFSTNTYTAPSDGFIFCGVQGNGSQSTTINGKQVAITYNTGVSGSYPQICIPVCKDDIFTTNASLNWAIFYPIKGVN